MGENNCCYGCIGTDGNECCIDVYLVLNPDELSLFKEFNGFIKVEGGGIYYTSRGCPYFKDNNCLIHSKKPLYCKYYPIFITGKPFIHDECSIHKKFELPESKKNEICQLQTIYPIYKRDWYWEDLKKEFPWIGNIESV
ncbi:MAG: YkgJ family cysteine cluster protein [Candidatus Heimdallarchaeota archaeon]|nr:MAG: YkgJ family cysteine cluster protein [Candidatus Heimdallarchaeota archaeon]